MSHYEEAEKFINKYEEVLDLMNEEGKRRGFKFFGYMYVRCNDSIDKCSNFERYTSQGPLHKYDVSLIKDSIDDILQ